MTKTIRARERLGVASVGEGVTKGIDLLERRWVYRVSYSSRDTKQKRAEHEDVDDCDDANIGGQTSKRASHSLSASKSSSLPLSIAVGFYIENISFYF